MDWRWSAACVQRVERGHIVSPRAQLVSSFCGMVFFVNPTVNNPIRSFQEPIPKMFVFSQRITAWCFHGSAATAVECLAHQLGSVQPGTIPFRLLPQPSTLPPLLRGKEVFTRWRRCCGQSPQLPALPRQDMWFRRILYGSIQGGPN